MPKIKPVFQYTERGALVGKYPSATVAAKAMNVTIPAITTCCRGETRTCKGYVWKYQEDFQGEAASTSCTRELFYNTEVQMFDRQGNLLATFQSVDAASFATGLHTLKIVDMIAFPEKRRQGKAAMYIFKIKE